MNPLFSNALYLILNSNANLQLCNENNTAFTPGSNESKLLPQLIGKREVRTQTCLLAYTSTTAPFNSSSWKRKYKSSMVILTSNTHRKCPQKSINGWNQKAQLEIRRCKRKKNV